MKSLPVLVSVTLLTLSSLAPAGDFYEGEKHAAGNPVALHLFPDPGELKGWISGNADLAGKTLTIEDNGESHRVEIAAGNTFRWSIEGEKARTVRLQYGDTTRVVSIPPARTDAPVAFFVVDRSVYRPNGELQFAAFLRQRDGEGRWQPLQRDDVEIEIKSVTKNITAAKLKLAADDFGRVVGTYKFSKADAHDDYIISVGDGIAGSATVKLAEFRKAKVRLAIDSERTGQSLTIKFRALDFLNKPVPASTLRFTGKVVRKSEPAFDLWDLDPSFFPGWEERDDHWYALSAEEQALLRAGEAHFAAPNSAAVHQFSEELEVGEDGEVEYKFTIDPAWNSDHHLVVEGTMIDSNNREQKGSKHLPLSNQSDESILVETPRSEVPAGQPVEVAARSSGNRPVTFVIFRLRSLPAHSASQWPPLVNPFLLPEETRESWNQPIPGIQFGYPQAVRSHGRRGRHAWRQHHIQGSIITREFLSLSPGLPAGQEGLFRATMHLAQPGAYLIRAISHDDDNREVRGETTVVIVPKQHPDALHLGLSSDRLERGQPLRGSVQSRYHDARVLLVVRDSHGVQALQPVTLKDGAADFEIALPHDLSLGCELTARYTDDGQAMHLDRERFLVAPPNGELQIASKLPETVEPGKEVELEFSVNRKEEVDLVVSVYDQSLLGIAPERAVDGRSLFHADLRVEERAAEAMVESLLAGLTPNLVLEELDAALKDAEAVPSKLAPNLKYLRTQLGGRFHPPSVRRGHLYEQHLRILLAWRGAPIQFLNASGSWQVEVAGDDYDAPIAELIRREGPNNGRLAFDLIGQHLALWSERLVNGEGQLLSYDPLFQRGGYAGWFYPNIHFGYSNSNGGGGFTPVFNNVRTRGDAHRSIWDASGNGLFSATANAAHSSISGQAMISHLDFDAALLAAAAPGNPAQPDQAARTIRRDFSDSAFFNAKVRTDADGVATVQFKLPDSLTNWRVVVTAVSRDLDIARHTAGFKTYKPVMVWPMLSQSFTAGDRVKIFATVHNRTDAEQDFTVATEVKNGTLHGEVEKKVSVAPKSNAPVYFDFEAGSAGFTEILMSAKCAAGDDASLKRLPVHPCTAEQVVTRSGFVKGETTFEVPENIDLTQARLEVTIAPSLAGDMVDSLGYLVTYPHGCVEQTMSRFLPVIKVAQILDRFEIDDPRLKEMVPRYAEAGVKRLLQLQKPDGGWGWNGISKTHEMMTPYALFGLVEAQKAGFEIASETAIPRGMDRLAGFINSMGDRQSADRIYCMWVYRHHGKLTDDWWRWLVGIVERTFGTERDRSRLLSDYAAALALEMAAETGRTELAGKLERLLVYRAKRNGSQAHWTSANFSRWGNDRFEITAAVLKAFAAHDPDHEIVPSILSYFVATKRGNRWNSTKDTAMILFAMCDYLSTQELGGRGRATTRMTVNGEEHELVNPSWRPATLVIEGANLKFGPNTLAFLEGDKKHLYRLVFRFWRNGEDVSPLNQGAVVSRAFELLDADGKVLRQLQSGDTVPRGSYIRSKLSASIQGRNFEYTLSANPKLSCGEYTPLHDKQRDTAHVLKESKAAGTFWHHEQSGNRIDTHSVVRAELAGAFLIAPAYVELMYDTAIRGHSGAFKLIVEDED